MRHLHIDLLRRHDQGQHAAQIELSAFERQVEAHQRAGVVVDGLIAKRSHLGEPGQHHVELSCVDRPGKRPQPDAEGAARRPGGGDCGARECHALAQQSLRRRRVGRRAEQPEVVRHLRLDDVAGLQHGVDVGFRDRAFALAQQVEQVLEHMRQRRDLVESEHGRAALDRMHGAENGVQVVGIGRGRIEAQQDLFGSGQVLLGFLEKDGAERTAIAECGGALLHERLFPR